MLTRLRRCPEISGESESNNVTSAQSPICKCPRNCFNEHEAVLNIKNDRETVLNMTEKPFDQETVSNIKKRTTRSKDGLDQRIKLIGN